MEYLWLLPVLLPAVGFFWSACGCCDQCAEAIIVTEQVGNGYIILHGDSNIIRLIGSTSVALANDQYGENLLEFIKAVSGSASPVIRCDGDLADWQYGPGSELAHLPPSGTVAIDGESGADAIWAGVGFREYFTPSDGYTAPSVSLSWIQAGGVLLLVADNETFYSSLNSQTNTYLTGLGVLSRIVGGTWGSSQENGSVNASHPLVDGTYGSPASVAYNATATVIASDWVARTSSGSLKPDGSRWSTTCP